MQRRRKRADGELVAGGGVDVSGEPPPLSPEEIEAARRRFSDQIATAPLTWVKGSDAGDDGPVPRVPVGWGNVIEDTLRIKDPASLARRLREELSLGEGRTSYGAVLEALDRSARNLDDAGRLHRAAKVEEETYTLQVAARLEVMRSAAMAELMEEYRQKRRPSPVARDVEDRIVQSWPDEFRTIQARISELHAAVRSLETLRDAWASRCADLRIMADKTRPLL